MYKAEFVKFRQLGSGMPGYLDFRLSWLGDIHVRQQHRNWSYPPPAVQHSATARSLSLLHAHSVASAPTPPTF